MVIEKTDSSDHLANLRRRAVERIRGRFPHAGDVSALALEDVQKLVHDLQVQQVELEMQNEELRLAQDALHGSRDRYSDLYDFAPVGYFTLDRDGIIRESNLTGASLLNVPRESIIGIPFHRFVSPESQDAWYRCQQEIYRSEKCQTCEVRMRKHNGGEFDARLESIVTGQDGQAGHHFRTVVSDITDLKRAEEQLRSALEEKQVLLREIHHRVKNNLALVCSLLTLHSGYAMDEVHCKMFEDLEARVRSMAVAHEKLYQSESLANLDVREYIDGLVDHLVGSAGPGTPIHLSKEIEPVSFGLDTAIPVGFILTELVANCLKHAFPDRSERDVGISLRSIAAEEFELVVKDNGIGMPEEIDIKHPESLGLDLVNGFVDKLQGGVEIVVDNGTQVRVRFKEI